LLAAAHYGARLWAPAVWILTTDANAEVGAIHSKAMPVILTSSEAVEQWLTLPVKEALALQTSLPNGALRIVATGEKEDGLAA
jgi:putative SOS response-associated peptidase YedK